MVGIYLRTLLLIVLDGAGFMFLLETFLTRKRTFSAAKSRIPVLLSYALLTYATVYFIPYKTGFLLAALCKDFLITVFFYSDSLFFKSILVLLNTFLTLACHLVTSSFVMWSAQMSLDDVYLNHFVLLDFLNSFLYVAFLFLLYRAWRGKRKNWTLPIKDWCFLLFVPVMSLVTIEALMEQLGNGSPSNGRTVLASLLLLLLNPVVFYLLDACLRREETLRKNLLMRQQSAAQSASIRSLSKSYREQRHFMHDYDNQLAIISQLVASEKYTAAREYIEHLNGEIGQTIYRYKTGNDLIDAVLNSKDKRAEKSGIAMDISAGNLAAIPVSENDLAVILANVLDNAIEACRKNSRKSRIEVTLHCQNRQLLLSVKNTIDFPVAIQNNAIETTKPDPALHGLGLPAVKTILEKYGCEYELKAEDGWFIFAAFIGGVVL